MRRISAVFLSLAVGAIALAPRGTAGERQTQQQANKVNMGVSSTLFQGMPESVVMALMKPFESLLIEQTGLGGDMVSCGDGCGVAQALLDGKIDVGVFEGIEFAWARQKHPQLRPLMITVNQEKCLHAYVVVRKDAKAQQFGDLKGKALGEVRNAREHCRLFVRGLCEKVGAAPQGFFSQIQQGDNAESVLDDVVDGVVQAAVIDNVCMECFKKRKPGRCALLKVLLKSEAFPASVIAFRDGHLDEATQKKFQQGMVNANSTALGKQMLTLWKLTAFQPVPDDFEQTLTNIAKMYPAPRKVAAAE